MPACSTSICCSFRHLFYAQGAGGSGDGLLEAAGIDKSAFATVFNLSRQARGEAPSLARADMEEADGVFARFTRAAALEDLQAAGVH